MAYGSYNLTMDGTSQSIWPLNATTRPHKPIKWLRLENPTGNADVLVGDVNLSATVYGFTLEDGPTVSKDIGPFGGGECPFNLENVYVRGTNTQILHISYMTL